MFNEKILKSEEKVIFALRSLYGKYGYIPYKMSKFEEYELYMRNKNFLTSDRIITFNDTNGKLLALKPDVTLSIIKSGEDIKGFKQKVYYNENVYRVSAGTHRFKEIMQTGLECIGDIDAYDIFEVIKLAAESLMEISESFVLEISHLGLLSAILESTCSDIDFFKSATDYIKDKNIHDLLRLCEKYGVEKEKAGILAEFAGTNGKCREVIDILGRLFGNNLPEEIKTLSEMLDTLPYSDKIIFDFSLVNDMHYYNGFVFRGYISGIADSVLAGGQYDKMMEKMGRKSGAIGFAIYLDMLNRMDSVSDGYDVDIVLLYSDGDDSLAVANAVSELTQSGKTVSAQKSIPKDLRYKELINFGKDGSKC